MEKVRLTKVAFDWMNKILSYDEKEMRNKFEFYLWKEIRKNHLQKDTVGFLISNGYLDIIDLVNAFQFGYELDVKKEDEKTELIKKIKVKFDMWGIVLFDEDIEKLIKMIKGD